MGVGAAFLREEMPAVLPCYVTGTVMTAAWGDKGSTAHPSGQAVEGHFWSHLFRGLCPLS